MRKCYDSTTSQDCPSDGDLYAGYVDGIYKWSDADWALHAGKVLVRIAVLATTNDGHVLDIENGAAYPTQAPAWVRMRRAAGVDPSVYVNLSNWDQVKNAFIASGDAPPHYWLAHYDNAPFIPVGCVAKQYADAAMTGGHYDVSVVEDYWEGVDQVVSQADFDAYKENVRQTIEAMKAAYDPLVTHVHEQQNSPTAIPTTRPITTPNP